MAPSVEGGRWKVERGGWKMGGYNCSYNRTILRRIKYKFANLVVFS